MEIHMQVDDEFLRNSNLCHEAGEGHRRGQKVVDDVCLAIKECQRGRVILSADQKAATQSWLCPLSNTFSSMPTSQAHALKASSDPLAERRDRRANHCHKPSFAHMINIVGVSRRGAVAREPASDDDDIPWRPREDPPRNHFLCH